MAMESSATLIRMPRGLPRGGFTLGELIPQTPTNKPFIPVHSTVYSGSAVLSVPRSGTLHEIAQ